MKTPFTSDDVLLTHKDCMDGAGCAIVFQHFGGQESNVHFSVPRHDCVDVTAIELLSDCRGTLYLADISVSEEAAMTLGRASNVKLFDHHASAVPLARFPWCTIDVHNKRCGSKVFLDFALSRLQDPEKYDVEALKRFINTIDDRDRWINADPRNGELSDLFYFMQPKAFVNEFAQKPSLEFDERFKFIIQIERDKRREYVEHSLKRVVVDTLDNFRVGFITCDLRYTSDVGNVLATFHNLDAVVLISPTNISLRSGKWSNLNMSAIAKVFGGGGHVKAAGFPLENLLGETLLERVHGLFKQYDFRKNNFGQHTSGQREADHAIADIPQVHS